MTKRAQFWIFFIFVIFIASYSYYDYWNEQKNEKFKQEDSKIVGIPQDQISEVEFKTSNEGISWKKTSEGWKFFTPISEMADKVTMDEFLSKLVSEKSKELVKEGENLDFKIFGLEAPLRQLIIKNNSGEITTLSVSNKKNFEGDSFLRRNQENKIYVVSSFFDQELNKKPFDFRNKKVIQKGVEGIKAISIQKNSKVFTLEKQNDLWTSKEQKKWTFEESKIFEFIKLFSDNNAESFLYEGDVNNKILQQYDLLKPSTSVNVEWKDGSLSKISIVKNKSNQYLAYTSNPSRIIQVQSNIGSKLLSLDFQDFRNTKEPFQFEVDKASKIQLKTPLKVTQLTKKENVWSLDGNDDVSYQVDQGNVKKLLDNIKTIEALQFLGNEKNLLPEKNQKEISFFNSNNEQIYKIQIGELYKKKIKENEKTLHNIKTSSFNEIVSVDEYSIKKLELDALVKKKEASNKDVEDPLKKMIPTGEMKENLKKGLTQ